MVNSLEEMIEHCEKVAEKNEKECKNWAYGASQINDDENRKKQYQKHAEMWHECANEHRQLAEWLKVLKEIWDSGDCNDCRNGQCEWKPKLGQLVRYNCPHYVGIANEEVNADDSN